METKEIKTGRVPANSTVHWIKPATGVHRTQCWCGKAAEYVNEATDATPARPVCASHIKDGYTPIGDSSKQRFVKACGTNRNDRHFPVETGEHVTCKICLGKIATLAERGVTVVGA